MNLTFLSQLFIAIIHLKSLFIIEIKIYVILFYNFGQFQILDKIMARIDGSHFVGCPVDDYDKLLADKVSTLRNLITGVCGPLQVPDIEVFESPKSHFRMRANFNIWRDTPAGHRKDQINKETPTPESKLDDFYYAMFDPAVEGKKKPVCEIKSFPRGTVFLNKLMDAVMLVLKTTEFAALSRSLFEVRFVCTQTEQAVIVLLYRRPLPDGWAELSLKALNAINPENNHVVKIVGRSNKVKVIVGSDDDIIEEVYTVTQEGIPRQISLYQTEGAFSQPNATVCEKMLSWVCNITSSSSWQSRDLLELYCGGGTFTAALCKNFKSVLATEISKASVELAERCFEKNQSSNVKVARMSSEEFEMAVNGTRPGGGGYKRLSDKDINITDYDFSTVFVDPPRAGLDAATCKLLTTFDHILYISCNPETLARDMGAILSTGQYTVERLAAFDQFPYTHHLESGVYLKKKDANLIDSASEEENNCKKRKAEGESADMSSISDAHRQRVD